MIGGLLGLMSSCVWLPMAVVKVTGNPTLEAPVFIGWCVVAVLILIFLVGLENRR